MLEGAKPARETATSELGPDQKPPGWDAVAPGYERTFEPFARLFAEEALRCAGVGPGERVLDVGAGPGALTLLAAKTGAAEVLAVDFAPAMVERLRRRLAEEGVANAGAEVMDGQALDLPDGFFDAALSNFALMIFSPDIARGLAEMHRVLKPGGRVAVTAWAAPERQDTLRVLTRAVRTAVPEPAVAGQAPGVVAPERARGVRDAAARGRLPECPGRDAGAGLGCVPARGSASRPRR